MMPRWVRDNFVWKLLSLAMSVTIWLAFVGGQEAATILTARVQYRNLPKGLELSSPVQETMQLEVRGPSGKLSSGLEAAAVVFDLARVSGPGRQTFTITGDHVGLPAGVFFSRAVPAQVRLEFDRRIEKEALVLVRVSTPPAAGYEIVRMESSPAALRIVGPASRLESIKSVQTDPIPLDEVQGVREFVVQAFAGDPYVRFERPPEVRVRVEVALKGVRKQP